MVAGGLLPATVWYWLIGGAVLVAVMALFIGGLLGVVWLFKRAEKPQEHPDPWREYRPIGDRLSGGRIDGPVIHFSGHHGQQIDHQPKEQLPAIQSRGALCRRDR